MQARELFPPRPRDDHALLPKNLSAQKTKKKAKITALGIAFSSAARDKRIARTFKRSRH
jgi:hypothetical protein